MTERIINVKPKNVNDICKFLDDSYLHVGYGGGLTTTEKLYFEGISFKSIDKNYFLKNSPTNYQVIIQNPKNFTKEKLDKLIKMATNDLKVTR